MVVSTDDVITDTIVLPTSVIGRTMRINVRVNLYCETTDSSRDIMLSIQDDDDSIESSRVLGQIASSVSGIDRSCLSTEIYHLMVTNTIKISVLNSGALTVGVSDSYVTLEEALCPTIVELDIPA